MHEKNTNLLNNTKTSILEGFAAILTAADSLIFVFLKKNLKK